MDNSVQFKKDRPFLIISSTSWTGLLIITVFKLYMYVVGKRKSIKTKILNLKKEYGLITAIKVRKQGAVF